MWLQVCGMVCVALFFWTEWISVTETWSRKNCCATAVAAKTALPPAVCFGQWISESCNPHCSDSAHFLNCFLSMPSIAISINLHIPGQRSQYMICKPHYIGFPLSLQCSTFQSVPARLSLPGCSIHIIAILGELWLTTPTLHYATCSITVHLPLLSSGSYVLVLGHYTIIIPTARLSLTNCGIITRNVLNMLY